MDSVRSWVVGVARSDVCSYLYPKVVGLWGWIADMRIFDTRLRRERRWSGRWARWRGVSGAGWQACAGDRWRYATLPSFIATEYNG